MHKAFGHFPICIKWLSARVHILECSSSLRLLLSAIFFSEALNFSFASNEWRGGAQFSARRDLEANL